MVAPLGARARRARLCPHGDGQGACGGCQAAEGQVWEKGWGGLAVICGQTVPWLTCGQEAVQREMSRGQRESRTGDSRWGVVSQAPPRSRQREG